VLETTSSLHGTPVRQFSVFLLNRAGALHGVVKLLRSHGVNALAVSIQDSVDVTVVRFILSDPETAEALFIERGIPFGTCELIVVELPSGADQLDRCLETLTTAETNISFMYPLLSRPGGKAALALHVEDMECAAPVLAAEGFRLLRQEDISR
jgi:hypothetical protein